MRKKNLLILVVLVIGLFSFATIGSTTGFAGGIIETVQSASISNIFNFFNNEKTKIPDEILYDKLFRMQVKIMRKAQLQESEGQRKTGFTEYFKTQAKLSDEENQKFELLASEYMQEVSLLDSQAIEIISRVRQNYQGNFPKDEPPPKEIVELQEKRNKLALQYKEYLAERLGKEGFDKLDEFVQTTFASRLNVIPFSSIDFSKEQ
jgi:hypothetical protein